MADVSTEQIIAFFNNLNPGQVTQLFEDIKSKSASAASGLSNLVTRYGDVYAVAEKLKITTEETSEKLQELTKFSHFVEFIQGINISHQELVNLTGQVALLGTALVTHITPTSFNVLGEAARGATSNIIDALETTAKFTNIIPFGDRFIKPVIQAVEPIAKLADTAKQAEFGLIQLTSASGELGDLSKNLGDDLENLSSITEKFSQMTYQVANASGLNTQQVAEYAKELMGIPGTMDMVIESSQQGVKDIHLLDATIKAAVGTGQNFSQVFNDMNFVYKEFGTTGKESLEYVTRLSSASQGLKLPLDLVKEYTQNAALSFKFLGDNSQAALNILERFSPTLKDSGLGPKAIKELVGDITQGIAQMNVAQKAFLSGQTGGAKGLQGAYQIELLLQQGKLDEVQSKIETSLKKQFGGRIVTLEEAAKDSRAAGQFTKQVQLLTQGPTKIANSEAEAYKILEVLAKGNQSTPGSIIKSPDQAFKDALQFGDTLQERQTNILTQIQNDSDRMAQLAAISAYNLTRLVAGTEGKNLGSYLNQKRNDNTELLASTGKLVSGEGLEGGREIKDVMSDFFENLPNEYKNFGQFTDVFKTNLNGAVKEKFSSTPPSSQETVIQKLNQRQKLSKETSESIIPSAEELSITIRSLCEKCFGTIAEQKATKIGKQLIQDNESNRAISLHTGVHSKL